MTDVQASVSAVQPVLFEEVAAQFLAYLRASGCSPNTARAYGHDLTRLAAFLVEQGLDWRALTPARAVDLLIYLRGKRSRRRGCGHHPSLVTIEGERAVPRLSAATINRTLAAVSSFYEWAQATDRFAGPGRSSASTIAPPLASPSVIVRFSTASLHSRRRAAPCG